MTKGKATVLGIFTIWPLFYCFLFVGAVFIGALLAPVNGSEPSDAFRYFFMIIIALHFLTMIGMLILLVIYLRYLFKTAVVPKDKKTLWAVVLFLGNMISMPIFWYLYVWKQRKDDSPEPVVPPEQQDKVTASP